MAVDSTFIEQLEGTKNKGYVPSDDSGVTIASGLDLGQQSEKSLKAMGLPDNIIYKLTPYLGHKGNVARDMVDNYPLQLSDKEVQEIDKKAIPYYAKETADWYNKNNKAGNTFADLNDRQQTVITSVYYQYGIGSKKTPNFNDQVLHNKWKSLVQNLENFKDSFGPRRHQEINYLVGAPPSSKITPTTKKFIEKFKKEPNVVGHWSILQGVSGDSQSPSGGWSMVGGGSQGQQQNVAQTKPDSLQNANMSPVEQNLVNALSTSMKNATTNINTVSQDAKQATQPKQQQPQKKMPDSLSPEERLLIQDLKESMSQGVQ